MQMSDKEIKSVDWEIVQKVGKAVSDWGGHEEISEALEYFRENHKARKIILEMADVEARKAEEATLELRKLFFELKKVLIG
jgi:hypothetical protein